MRDSGIALTLFAALITACLWCAGPLRSEVPMLPLEREALEDPAGVLSRLPALLRAAEQRPRELALLELAQANACRVVADWVCQRDAGARAAGAARLAGDRLLESRGLIALARGRIALGEFYSGETALGDAMKALQGQHNAELEADVFLGYSSLSHHLGRPQAAVDYARKGLGALGGEEAVSMRVRLLRNLARGFAALRDWEAAAQALNSARGLIPQVGDPKLVAEIALETARIAHERGDQATQLQSAGQILTQAARLQNSQLEGLGQEVLARAASQAGDLTRAREHFALAAEHFRKLDKGRDELRVTAAYLRLALDQPELPRWVIRHLQLEESIGAAERARAVEGIEERLRYTQQEVAMLRLESEATLARSETASLALRLQLNVLLAALITALLMAVGALAILQRRANRRLSEAVDARQRALVHTSHEMRNALVAIKSLSDLLSRQALAGTALEMVHTIQKASDHLTGLAQDLLDRGRLEAGKIRLYAHCCELAKLLQQVMAMHAALAREKGVSLALHCDSRAPALVRVDALRLVQVLANLIGNALKFTDRGCVSLIVEVVETRAQSSLLRFAVEDTGPGLSAEELDRLFEPFMQTAAGQRHGTGAGLGLSISHDLVKLMGGALRGKAGAKSGCRFQFDLVLEHAQAEESPTAFPPPGSEYSPAQALTVVTVDDDETVLLLYRELLEPLDVHPHLHDNLAHALRLHNPETIDLLLVDYELGDVNSVQWLQHHFAGVSGRRPRIAVVSGHPAPDSLPHLIDEWLQKPVSSARFSLLISAARRAASMQRTA